MVSNLLNSPAGKLVALIVGSIVLCGLVLGIFTAVNGGDLRPTPPSEQPVQTVVADCLWRGTAEAFVDENTNKRRDTNEPPLAGMNFQVDDTYNHYTNVGSAAVSNAQGTAALTVALPGCPRVVLEVYPQVPEGYALTTPERLAAGDQSGQTFPFGFVRLK